jgi:hypothetical protein
MKIEFTTYVHLLALLLCCAPLYAVAQKTCPAGSVQVGETHSTKPDGTPVTHILCQQQDTPDPPQPVTLVGPEGIVYSTALHEPVSSHSAPGIVLINNQGQILALDAKIRKAQEALRSLIESHSRDEEQRVEWEKESEEATTDAKSLGIKLVLDLAGAHNDGQLKINEKEREEALSLVLNRTEGSSTTGQSIMAVLKDRKDELDHRAEVLETFDKAHDLTEKISEIDKDKSHDPAPQKLWDALSNVPKVKELTGPWADIVDSAYTIYRQADSLDHLANIEANSDKILVAQASLQRLVKQLELQRKALQTPDGPQP